MYSHIITEHRILYDRRAQEGGIKSGIEIEDKSYICMHVSILNGAQIRYYIVRRFEGVLLLLLNVFLAQRKVQRHDFYFLFVSITLSFFTFFK